MDKGRLLIHPLKSIKDIQKFTEGYLLNGDCFDFPNANNQLKYFTILKKDDVVSLGEGTKGESIFMPVLLSDANIIKRLYHIRRSINAYLFTFEGALRILPTPHKKVKGDK